MADGSEITQALQAFGRGEAGAFDRLMPLVYENLRRVARRQLRGPDQGRTLSTTGLVHEAYLKLVDQAQASINDRGHFFAVASRAMRQILIDRARRRHAIKRGGDARVTDLDDVDNFAVPVRTAVRRYGQTEDIPVAVFNTHLEYDNGDDNSADRFKELQEMIGVIRKLLAAEPSAFNNAVGDPLRSSPLHEGNRIILTGDFNMRAHHCGEHQWLIKELRTHFGYALDASQATFDPVFGVHAGTHDVSGQVPNPLPFTSEWMDHPQFDMLSPFPWWATTYRGKTGGPGYRTDRYDTIILVGRGWAKDDPLVDYRVMNDNNFSTIMNDADAGAEMWQPWSNYGPVCSSVPQSVTDGRGYRPNHELGCGVGRGQPALHSDHRPITARIRVGGLPVAPSQ